MSTESNLKWGKKVVIYFITIKIVSNKGLKNMCSYSYYILFCIDHFIIILLILYFKELALVYIGLYLSLGP